MKRYIRCSYNEESVRDLYNALNRIEKKGLYMDDDSNTPNQYEIVARYNEVEDYEYVEVRVTTVNFNSRRRGRKSNGINDYYLRFSKSRDGAFSQDSNHPSVKQYYWMNGGRFADIDAVIDFLRRLIKQDSISPDF